MPRSTTRDQMRKQRDKLIVALTKQPGWITGSLVETERAQAGNRKPFCYLSRSIKGKNSTAYVPADQIPAFRRALRQGRKAREIFGRISQLNIRILKREKKDSHE